MGEMQELLPEQLATLLVVTGREVSTMAPSLRMEPTSDSTSDPSDPSIM